MIQGYGIDVDYDGQTLRVHGRNKAARIALAGIDHDEGDVVVPLEQVAAVDFKDASMLVNGNLKVTTTAGATYQLHFRRKQADEFRELAGRLHAV